MDQKICHGEANAFHELESGCRCIHTDGCLIAKLLTVLRGHGLCQTLKHELSGSAACYVLTSQGH